MTRGNGVRTNSVGVDVLDDPHINKTNPVPFLILFGVFAAVFAMSNYVSLSSICGAVLYPVVLRGTYAVLYNEPMPGLVALASILLACLIVWCHRENLKRIGEGKERKTYLRKKNKNK